MHPRTDPVVITAVLDESGEKILLGRNVGHRSTNANCESGQRLILFPILRNDFLVVRSLGSALGISWTPREFFRVLLHSSRFLGT